MSFLKTNRYTTEWSVYGSKVGVVHDSGSVYGSGIAVKCQHLKVSIEKGTRVTTTAKSSFQISKRGKPSMIQFPGEFLRACKTLLMRTGVCIVGMEREKMLKHGMKMQWTATSGHSMGKIISGLSKPRLSGLVVLTLIAGTAASPVAASASTLGAATLGTGLCVASANIFNQWREAPFDAQMARTRVRPLVRWRILPHRVFLLGLASGSVGTFAFLLTFKVFIVFSSNHRYHLSLS